MEIIRFFKPNSICHGIVIALVFYAIQSEALVARRPANKSLVSISSKGFPGCFEFILGKEHSPWKKIKILPASDSVDLTEIKPIFLIAEVDGKRFGKKPGSLYSISIEMLCDTSECVRDDDLGQLYYSRQSTNDFTLKFKALQFGDHDENIYLPSEENTKDLVLHGKIITCPKKTTLSP